MGTRSHSYRMRMPLAAASALLAVLALGFLRPGAVSSRTAKDAFWTDKVFGEKKYNVVFSGDSRIYRGISPQKVQEAMLPDQVKVLNLGFSAGGHNQEMFDLIRQRMDTSGLRVIVLGLTPFSLTRQGQENGHLHDLKDTPRYEQFLNLKVNPRLMFIDPINKDEMKEWVAGDSVGYYERFMPDGWVASTRLPLRPEEALAAYSKEFIGNSFSEGVFDTLLIQLRAWNKEGIKVFAFRPPTTEAMVDLEDSLSGFQEEAVRQRWESEGGLWLDPGPVSAYTSYDGSHIDWRSAEILSARLGEEIRKKLSGHPYEGVDDPLAP